MSPNIHRLATAAAAVAALSVLLCGAGRTGAGESASCVAWRAESRPGGYGYDHVVVLDNHCDAVAVCQVSSDAAPAPITVSLEPGEVAEVTTFRGSPDRAMAPVVVCTVAFGGR
ncbi:MAG TPA: hypothetical protein VND93_28090 [Myxococcales bacterium]|jgi:hypothetical protein|nr:hypothetical protein [Myxococcales bacterium]